MQSVNQLPYYGLTPSSHGRTVTDCHALGTGLSLLKRPTFLFFFSDTAGFSLKNTHVARSYSTRIRIFNLVMIGLEMSETFEVSDQSTVCARLPPFRTLPELTAPLRLCSVTATSSIDVNTVPLNTQYCKYSLKSRFQRPCCACFILL